MCIERAGCFATQHPKQDGCIHFPWSERASSRLAAAGLPPGAVGVQMQAARRALRQRIFCHGLATDGLLSRCAMFVKRSNTLMIDATLT